MAKKSKIAAKKMPKIKGKITRARKMPKSVMKKAPKTTEITFGEGLIAGAQEILEYYQGDETKVADIRYVEIKPVPKITASDIKKIRKQNHLSQTMLAGILNVSNRTVEAWEHGVNEPSGGSARADPV